MELSLSIKSVFITIPLLPNLLLFCTRNFQFSKSLPALVLVLYQFSSPICQVARDIIMKARESVPSNVSLHSPKTFCINKLKW